MAIRGRGFYGQQSPYRGYSLAQPGYVDTYAGMPIEEAGQLGEALQQKYYQGLEGMAKIEAMRQGMDVLEQDQGIVDDAFGKVGEKFASFKDEGNYESAAPAVIEAATYISGNKDLNTALSNRQSAANFQAQLQKRLEDGDIEDWQAAQALQRMGGYQGVKSGESIGQYLQQPSHRVNVTERIQNAAKTVRPHYRERQRWRPDLGKYETWTEETYDRDEIDSVIQRDMFADPQFMSYYNEMVDYYGKDQADQMMKGKIDAYVNAYQADKISNRSYVLPAEGYGPNAGRGPGMGGTGGAGFESSANINITQRGYGNLRSEYRNAQGQIEELQNQKAIAIEQAGGDPNIIASIEREFAGRLDEAQAHAQGLSQTLNDLHERVGRSSEGNQMLKDRYQTYKSMYMSENNNSDEGLMSEKDFNDYIKNHDPIKPSEMAGAAMTGYGTQENADVYLMDTVNQFQKEVDHYLKDQDYIQSGYVFDAPPDKKDPYSIKIGNVNNELTRKLRTGGIDKNYISVEDNVQIDPEYLKDKYEGMSTQDSYVRMTSMVHGGSTVLEMSIMDENGNLLGKEYIRNGDPYADMDLRDQLVTSLGAIEDSSNATETQRYVARNARRELGWMSDIQRANAMSPGTHYLRRELPGGHKVSIKYDPESKMYTAQIEGTDAVTYAHSINDISSWIYDKEQAALQAEFDEQNKTDVSSNTGTVETDTEL